MKAGCAPAGGVMTILLVWAGFRAGLERFRAGETDAETDPGKIRTETAGNRINKGFSSLGGGSADQRGGSARVERRPGMATRRRTR